ncbi:helix-turn-helix domain-containing protein [Paenibacillus sp. MWE-103]|uniref:Helix-turn-helix domain-containing protein n=1 Tax=Paenibacillus artemisiicola TaxID=1172618 RepID=A0ABS3WLF1_9BACL|nr:helix-turn-helix domain-containing protein [Paenibacillus artemisiicola]MBO7749068.1 helix-turn-helix domain-containing protein [Paenibacillus artemisiicola]
MSLGKYSALEKLAILKEVSNGEIGFLAAAKKYEINKTTLMRWQRRYQTWGYEGLERRPHLQSYSAELKLRAVKDYLEGGLSQYQVIEKYKITSTRQLFNWVNKYNGHSSLKAYRGEAKAMTKGRSTSWQERIEIVQYCLAHDHNYQKAVEQFQVSYQQVYQWVKKFEDGGENALKDGRGRRKAPEELTEADQQKLKMKQMEHEMERLRAENAFLKKLEELERRRR